METPLIAEDILQEQKVWNSPDTLQYYQTHRQSQKDLYPSERFFLPDILPQVNSALDVGCAAGGFCGIMRSYNPRLRYVGLDITPELIARAKDHHPEGEFILSDGVNIPFASGSFDLVHSSGVLHLNSHYQDMLRSMWQQTQRYLLCDFRLTTGSSFQGKMKHPQLPYFVLNVNELTALLKNLMPQPAALKLRGYPHDASVSADLPQKQVIMAYCLLEKGPAASITMEINLDERQNNA